MKRCYYLVATGILLLVVISGIGRAPGADTDARAKQKMDAIEKVLPEYEKAADECEKALQPFLATQDDKVIAAVDGARIRIEALRSLRTIFAREPNYLTWHLGEQSLRHWKEGWEYFLACAKAGTDPFKDMTSGVRTVRSPIDGQLLFYVFRLPHDYDPKKRYPLEVSLHAGAGLTWRAGWIDGKPSTDPKKAEHDQIWMSPCGRGNNSYAGMGEVAVMDAIRDIQKRYAVDENRVMIGGASMGGTGGFRMAALHPDVFAVAHSLTGGANYSVPVNNGRFDATLLIDNFCNTGMCIWDAPKEGWWVQNHAFADSLRERAKKYAGSYPNIEITDPNGGHGIIKDKLYAEGWDWIRKQQRNPYPKRVIYKTYCLRYDGAYWVRIDTMEKADAPARIEAELLDGGKLRVAVENADRFHLNLVKELVGDGRELAVTVNDGEAFKAPAGKVVHFAKTNGKWGVSEQRYPAGLVKKHGLSGPIQDVFMSEPVLMVHGTLENRDAAQVAKMLDDAVLRLFGRGDGAGILHTAFDRKADKDVGAADIAGKNLVLFGTPKQNALVGKIADKLPVRFLDDGVALGGKEYRGKDVGVTLVYPNPLNPERYVLLIPEQYAGPEPLALPDYVIGKAVQNGQRTTQQVLSQGTFDGRWQVVP